MNEQRFEFGKNWQQFLKHMDEERIEAAIASVRTILVLDTLEGKTFLDIGCGSGLFSLAARRLGAVVVSFDYDQQSVACAQELKRRFAPDDSDWRIESGSVLEEEFLSSLGTFDVVYSWGVLHHTGEMWQAIENASRRVANNGLFCISIYNDQGGASRRWRTVKKLYNRSPGIIRWCMVLAMAVYQEGRAALIRAIRFQNPLPFQDWARKKAERGMSPWYDIVDWVGGYPFEVAKPEEVFDFGSARGMRLIYLTTQACGYGCNEFTFVKGESADS